MALVDFNKYVLKKKTYGGANGNKLSIIIDDNLYMLKLPTHAIKNDNMSYVFNNEIVAYDLADGNHGSNPSNHIRALKNLLKAKIKRGYKDLETIVHSDQGVIYSSMIFANTHKDYNIKRSMSRAGTPTDNPIIEAING